LIKGLFAKNGQVIEYTSMALSRVIVGVFFLESVYG
jgi:hypothetical protein